MSFYLAPSLVALRDEINERYPRRDKSSDGWIGDPSHAARPSDHNPDYGDGGVVRAIDIDIDGGTADDPLVKTVLEATIGDGRVYYVIFNRKIYSRTYGWEARYYGGSNPHDKHIHVSIMSNRSAEAGTATWLGKKRRVKPLPIGLKTVREQMQAARHGQKVTMKIDVKRLQRALNKEYGKHLDVDGFVGDSTLNSYGRHERAVGVKGAPRVPDWNTLPKLIKGRFYIREQADAKPKEKKK